MKMPQNKIIQKSIAILLIGIMSLMILDEAFFLHSHKLSDGTIIIHAHPYNKSKDSQPFKTHHHSDTVFYFYHVVSILFSASLPVLGIIISFKKIKHFIVDQQSNSSNFTFHKNNRAPPPTSILKLISVYP